MLRSLTARFGLHLAPAGTATDAAAPSWQALGTWLLRPRSLLPALATVLVVVYLTLIRTRLMPTGSTGMIELVVVGLLALALVVSAVVALRTTAVHNQRHNQRVSRCGSSGRNADKVAMTRCIPCLKRV